MGDSDDPGVGPKDYKLISGDLLIDLPMTKKEKAALESVADILLEMSEVDIKDCRAPMSASVETLPDERDRWDVMASPTHRVGTVVRTGEGSTKRYRLYLWDGGWYLVHGQPCFDLPLFGLADLRANSEAPVMIHEGPKSMAGAISRGKFEDHWMGNFVHLAWHGSDIGMEWTDWSPLRGRIILIWPDMDEAGLLIARALARKIALLGVVPEYIQWSLEDIRRHPSWDWGDWQSGSSPLVNRTYLNERRRKMESPVNAAGNLHEGWVGRSFYDANAGEVYQHGSNYDFTTLAALRTEHGSRIAGEIARSSIAPFAGLDYLPGRMFGRLPNGKINTCPPNARSHIEAQPLDRSIYRAIRRGWLKPMVPDLMQRKHLVRRAAWTIGCPHLTPQHMIVLQGPSSIGKSVFLDLVRDVVGRDRGVTLAPSAVLAKFNDSIVNRLFVGIHEIHGSELTKKQNATMFKELIANSSISIEAKGRPMRQVTNVIHWFAATNEKAPFVIEQGNDRFYIVTCEAPCSPRSTEIRRLWFQRWVPKMQSPELLDELYAAALHLVAGFSKKHVLSMTSRAPRQREQDVIAALSLPPWKQAVLDQITRAYENQNMLGKPAVFIVQEVKNYVARFYPRIGVAEVPLFLGEIGYCALKGSVRGKMRNAQARVGDGRFPLWCKQSEKAVALQTRTFETLPRVSLPGLNW